MANLIQGLRNIEFLEEVEEIEDQPRPKIPRVNLIDAQNPFDYYGEKAFYDNLGVTKDQFPIILAKFQDKFATSIPEHSPFVQFTVFLRYLKSNAFLRDMVAFTCVQLPRSTVHKIVNSVAKDIAFYSRTYIVYPTVEEQNIAAARVLEKYNFPGSPSLIDGTQCRIRWKSSQMLRFRSQNLRSLFRNKRFCWKILLHSEECTLDILFSSYHKINKISCGICFWASYP